MAAAAPRLRGDGSTSASAEKEPLIIATPPWTLKGDFYTICYWISGTQAAKLPSAAYSPLEASSLFGDTSSSRPVGGVGMIQVMRFKESPVGPYDELAIIPGKFEWARQAADGREPAGQDYKISRIYVSQKHTCYNGRVNWNIPKHLARFEWADNPNGSVTVKVYPHDTDGGNEKGPSSRSFFQATIKQVPLLPAFPLSTDWLGYVGLSTRAVFPPLPESKCSQGELPGTDRWCAISPHLSSNKTTLVTFDMSQDDADATGGARFWPELGRWRIGTKMSNATMRIGPPDETWDVWRDIAEWKTAE